MSEVRTAHLPDVYARSAETTIADPPVAGTAYRRSDLAAVEIAAGQGYLRRADSASFNQILWLISSLLKEVERRGVPGYNVLTDYYVGALCIASNGYLYRALVASGPNSGGTVDPIAGSGSWQMQTPGALVGGTLTAPLDLGENAGLALDAALSVTETYSGTTRAGVAGTALTFGDLCYLDPTDSKWEKADANSVAGADGDARGILGICVQSAIENAATNMLLSGVVRANAAFPSMTINAPVYVSETAGAVTNTQPVTADVVVRVVGFGWTAQELYFNPSPMYITHV